MNTISYHLLSPVIYALGWTLFQALWQGFAIVLSTALLLHLLRHQSSALRYRLGIFSLLTQLITSIGTFVWYYKPVSSTTPLPNNSVPMRSLAIHWQTVSQNVPWHQQIQLFLNEHLNQFVIIYLLGVVLFGLRLTGGWLYLQHLSRSATKPTSDRWVQLSNQLRTTLAIKTVVRVHESARIAVPMVVGMLKPVLLLPIGLATSLSAREIEAILAHELAHVKRNDYAVNLLQSVMEVLYFFHPALWWLSARVREEREHCCDDLAVQACGGDGRILAQALARVEELRLAQAGFTPSLAMALTTKRQLLLQRVRRMLGVPIRPIVSNGSLAGLTLATLLLVSVSVYAVQKQDKPDLKTKQPKPTRRHKVDTNSEYGMAGNKQVSYVIWKGQKLPPARVAKLQQQLDQVMAGKLSLDMVQQPDRDILLTIIEKNQAFDASMDALTESLSHIDYDNIVVTAENGVKATLAELDKINYDKIVTEVQASVSRLQPLSDSLSRLRSLHNVQLDSLHHLMNLQSKQMDALHHQMEKLRFPIEEFERSQETLEWRKQRLMEQREKILEKRQQMLRNEGKAKLDESAIEKQLELLEPEIKKQELGIEELNKQLEEAREKLEKARQPMEKFEKEMEQINQQMESLSNQMSKYGEDMSMIAPIDMDLIGLATTAAPARLARSSRGKMPIMPSVKALRVPAPPAAPVKSVKGVAAVSPSIPPPPPAYATPASAPKSIVGAATIAPPKVAPKPKK
jgi:beta-lactamase regulating signal transducer with metallopeptidase domain/uncharacterized coiled-coil protein SlyX